MSENKRQLDLEDDDVDSDSPPMKRMKLPNPFHRTPFHIADTKIVDFITKSLGHEIVGYVEKEDATEIAHRILASTNDDLEALLLLKVICQQSCLFDEVSQAAKSILVQKDAGVTLRGTFIKVLLGIDHKALKNARNLLEDCLVDPEFWEARDRIGMALERLGSCWSIDRFLDWCALSIFQEKSTLEPIFHGDGSGAIPEIHPDAADKLIKQFILRLSQSYSKDNISGFKDDMNTFAVPVMCRIEVIRNRFQVYVNNRRARLGLVDFWVAGSDLFTQFDDSQSTQVKQ